jgi:hypothetical protein
MLVIYQSMVLPVKRGLAISLVDWAYQNAEWDSERASTTARRLFARR